MTRYRIYTEQVNVESMINAARYFLDDFTATKGYGCYGGHMELCMVFESLIEGPPTSVERERVQGFCRWIKENNGQESVLVTIETEVKADLL